VRPKKKYLEVCLFLGRPLKVPQVKRVENPSRAKVANIVHITHRDQVEAPVTDWLREAYELPDRLAASTGGRKPAPRKVAAVKRKPEARKASAKRKPARKKKD
jgi:hypothetical protein